MSESGFTGFEDLQDFYLIIYHNIAGVRSQESGVRSQESGEKPFSSKNLTVN
ncbi:hypothetical protein [Trichormus sp. NMC-1]|uniref:hypothetical protein n=1 Tax=Trichormus sp. NMC-1 TaxID=1853259 RepID=UPI000B18F9E5|nr:hypothetical protein [Trichormus sp. NMC-1]